MVWITSDDSFTCTVNSYFFTLHLVGQPASCQPIRTPPSTEQNKPRGGCHSASTLMQSLQTEPRSIMKTMRSFFLCALAFLSAAQAVRTIIFICFYFFINSNFMLVFFHEALFNFLKCFQGLLDERRRRELAFSPHSSSSLSSFSSSSQRSGETLLFISWAWNV